MGTHKLGGYSSVHWDYFKSDDIDFIVNSYGTPTFILDVNAAREQLKTLGRALPDTYLYYSTKTNPHPAIINLIREQGHGFDVATLGEIKHVLAHGADPATLLYTHPVKSDDEIEVAHSLGVTRYTLDSIEELRHHHQLIPGAQHFVRIAPLSTGSLYNYRNKFGTSPGELIAILNYAVKNHIPITGLSFMVGSQTMTLEPWQQTLGYIAAIIRRYYHSLPSLRTINIGSGIPIDYSFARTSILDDIAGAVNEIRNSLPSDIKFISEVGRFIVGPSTILKTSVVQKLQRRAESWLYIDANAYSGLIEIIESGGQLPYPITTAKPGAEIPYMVAGKTLDPDDIFARNIRLSSMLETGDTLAIHDAGAYSSSFFTNYHCLPHPNIVVCDSQFAPNVRVTYSEAGFPGVRARRDIQADEIVFVVSGPITNSRTRTSFQLNETQHIEPTLFGAYLNHSCDPNVGIRTGKSGDVLEIVARRTIRKDEDIAIDYAMFEYETGPMSKITCQCGAADCRSFIGGYKYLPQRLREAYRTMTTDYLNSLGKKILQETE